MEFKKIDINTVVVDGITYTAVEHSDCTGCEFQYRSEQCTKVSCSSTSRSDRRSVIWKRKTIGVQSKSSSEHTKPMNITVVNENKIIINDVEYQSTYKNGCTGCALCGEICRMYLREIPCLGSDRHDGRQVIWKKVPDKQTHVSLLEIRKTKTYELNFKP